MSNDRFKGIFSVQPRQKAKRAVVSGDQRIPQTRTLHGWAQKYFDTWLKETADGSPDPCFDSGGTWEPDTVSKFFQEKDRAFCSGEQILQSGSVTSVSS